jgi:hypothetical protein
MAMAPKTLTSKVLFTSSMLRFSILSMGLMILVQYMSVSTLPWLVIDGSKAILRYSGDVTSPGKKVQHLGVTPSALCNPRTKICHFIEKCSMYLVTSSPMPVSPLTIMIICDKFMPRYQT